MKAISSKLVAKISQLDEKKMKSKILKLSTVVLLLLFIGASCQKEKEFSEIVEGYIVGSFICDETDGENGQATGTQTPRGYCILLESRENNDSHWHMDFYTFDIPIDLFDFPDDILSPNHNSNTGGPNFFPDSLQNTYKFFFRYAKQIESDEVHFVCFAFAMMSPFPWKKFDQITLRNENLIKE